MFSVGVCGTINKIILRAITSSIKCNINLDYLVVTKTIFLSFQNFIILEQAVLFFSIEPIAYHSLKVLVKLGWPTKVKPG